MDWQELQHESLEDLVEYLQLKGNAENEAWASAAFVNITFRFRKDLLEKCCTMCRKAGLTDTDAEEITNRAFENLYRYCAFKPAKCKVLDIERCFRYYLYQIARNEFADYVKPDESPYTGEEGIVTSAIDPEKEYTPERLSQLQQVEKELDELFAPLSVKHKIIYLTYMYHEHEGKYLPRQLNKQLREALNLSQSTIRVYKQQAFDLAKSKGYDK